MSDYSTWVHGTAGIVSGQVSSIGFFGTGAEFRNVQPGNADIIFPIATPVIAAGGRARLVRVFALYNASPGVVFQRFICWDGNVKAGSLNIDPSGDAATFYPNVAGPISHLGDQGFKDLEIMNVTRFDLKIPVPLMCGLALVASVQFNANSSIAFSSVGADFAM